MKTIKIGNIGPASWDAYAAALSFAISRATTMAEEEKAVVSYSPGPGCGVVDFYVHVTANAIIIISRQPEIEDVEWRIA